MPEYITSRYESDIVVSGTTAELGTTDGNHVFLSLGSWANKSFIKRITIQANTAAVTGYMDIRLLSDPAAYRAAVAPADEDYVMAAWNDEAGQTGPNSSWKLDERYTEGLPIEDITLTGSLYIMLETEDVGGTTLSDASTYDIKVYGVQKWDPESYFNRQHILDDVYWRNNTSTNVWTDLTTLCKNTTNIRLAARAFQMVAATNATEYFYVGAFNQFSKVYFDIAAGNTTQISLTAQYYKSDNTWQTLTIFDCTDADIDGSAYTLFSEGPVYWTPPTDWSATELPTTDGTPPDAAGWQFGLTQPRYYVRFGLTDISTSPTFYSIRIVPSILSGYS